jgi:hypothetical protein
MPSFVPTSADTLEEQRLYTQARLAQVACLDCLATVAVKKNSDHHTSIQWSTEALGECQVFARMAVEPGGRPVDASCPRLAASIEAAVREGRLTVGAEDGY